MVNFVRPTRLRSWLCSATVLAASLFAVVPQRIVSTAPSITEVLFALGLGNRVVGVSNFCHYPPEAEKIRKVGDYIRPDLETIVSLRPDLVIIQTNPVRLADRLHAVHLNVLEVNQNNLEAIYQSIRQVGAAAGVQDRATKLIASMQTALAAIRRRTAALPKTRVMFVVGRDPGSLDGLVVVGKASYLNELLQIGGGENIFQDASAPYPAVALEEVLARNPEVIIDMGEMSHTTAVTEAQKRAVVALWDRYPSLRAVREHRVLAVSSDIFVVPGPRAVDAARAFARMLHPEAGF